VLRPCKIAHMSGVNAESLHMKLQKLIRKNKKKSAKKRTARVQAVDETPTYYLPEAQFVYQQQSNFVPQTLEQQYQMNTLYRKQLHAEDDDTSATQLYSSAIQQAHSTGNIRAVQNVQQLVEENQKRRHIEMQYMAEIEARCRALMKAQQLQYTASPVDLTTMKLLEKSTRTLWVSKISELINEKRAEEYCSLYGKVLGVNIVEDEGKRCGFIEFAQADGVKKFLQTSNLMMCGERIVCKPANVTKAAVSPGIAASYVVEGSTTLSPLFQEMLDNVNARHDQLTGPDEPGKKMSMTDYFPNLPE